MKFLNFFKLDKNRLIDIGITFFIFLLLTLLYTQTAWLEVLERTSVDLRFFLRDPGERSVKLSDGVRAGKINPRASNDIVLLGIDEPTIRYFSEENIQWPFPWETHTQFVNFVSTGKPKSIFFDIVFIDRKRGETGLAAAFKNAGNVFINYPLEVTEISQKYSDHNERLELMSKWKIKPINDDAHVPELFEEMVPPIPALMKAAKGVGYANVIPDPVDHLIRRIPLVLKFEGDFYPCIDLILAMDYFESTLEDIELKLGHYIKIKNINPEKLVKKNPNNEIIIPINKYGFMDINYIGGQGSFTNISYFYFARDGSMAGNESLKDKVCMVAAYSVTGIASDVHKSPYGDTFGVEHHANALNTILMQDFLYRFSDFQNILLVFILALLCGFFLPKFKILTSTIVTLAAFFLYFMFAYIMFNPFNTLVIMFTPLLLIVLSFIGITIYRVMTEQKEKRYIRNTFSKFVSKSVVDDLLKNPHKLKLGGEKKVLTVMFSDIRGFTTLSEMLTPEELVEQLNIYLQAMTDLVFEYDGTLDKYIGDAIMAFWGAPIELEDHALKACKSALEQIRCMDEMNAKWVAEGKPTLDIGIGLNSGDMVVGNMGSSSRMDYTLMGDNVNLGARLEGTNKVYGTKIIIGDSTYEMVKDHVVARELDLIRVKGKNHPVKIYELIALK